jgi:hypothetical protein
MGIMKAAAFSLILARHGDGAKSPRTDMRRMTRICTVFVVKRVQLISFAFTGL